MNDSIKLLGISRAIDTLSCTDDVGRYNYLACCMELYSCLILLLFPFCFFYSPRLRIANWEGHLFYPEYNKNNTFRIISKTIGIGLQRYWGIGISIGLNFGIVTSLFNRVSVAIGTLKFSLIFVDTDTS